MVQATTAVRPAHRGMTKRTARTQRGSSRSPRGRPNGLVQAVQQALSDLTRLPPYEEAPEFYSDWGQEGEFKVEVGQGECAQ